MPKARFRTLDAERIVETVGQLRERIRERFPDANLGLVAAELLVVARDAARRSAEIRRPNFLLRGVSVLLVGLAAAAITSAIVSVHPHLEDGWSWAEVIQTLEASLGTLFFLGTGVLLITTIEARSKRRRCLDAVHEMRAMAHIVDMHQLTKDPERLAEPERDTPHSPARRMTPFELTRYLDYCSEMLALMGKIAALYVQGFPDPQALTAVDEVENLTTSLSRKIWQKIMILDDK
jgi:hypothetical protein